MTDELLPYYNRELAFVRKLGAEFAQANPKIAGRLRWSAEMSEDPHVSRIIEAFAFLTARIRHKIEDEFPEITESLLNILYPHYLAPIPSAAIVQMAIDRAQAKLITGYRVPRGSSLETELIDGQPCRFRSTYDVALWPIEVAAARYEGQPFAAPPGTVPAGTEAVVRLRFRTFAPDVRFQQLTIDSWRFFLNGQGQFIFELYEQLLNNVLGVAWSAPGGEAVSGDADDGPRPVGFELDEGLYDYSPRSFPGYRLLSEYFAFPEKFLFVELPGVAADRWKRVGTHAEIELLIFLNRHEPAMEQQVQRDTFRLGCTPIVNLYRQRAEPIRWQHTQMEYRIVPDARRPNAHEVYSVDKVVATAPDREEVEFAPFFSTRHAMGLDTPRAFWQASRRRAGYAAGQVDRAPKSI
jgi:type VI secretion system protein ImpG